MFEVALLLAIVLVAAVWWLRRDRPDEVDPAERDSTLFADDERKK